MIRARVKVDLNERLQKPSVNAPIASFFQKGQEIQIVDIVNGEENKGNSVWYKLDNGSFVWSGGVEGLNSVLQASDQKEDISKPSNKPPRKYDYNKEVLSIPVGWRNANANRVTIGIIDSGSISHPDLSVTQHHVNGLGVDDQKGHGTHVAGLIGGTGNNGIKGVSPTSSIQTINAYTLNIGMKPDDAAQAIQDAITLNCDLINMSLRIYQEDHVSLNKELSNALKKNIIIVAAIGEDDELEDDLYFPGKMPNVFGVGSFNSNYVDQIRKLNNQLVDVVLPNHKLWSTDVSANDYYNDRSGSSMASAIATGLISQLIAHEAIPKDPKRLIAVRDKIKSTFPSIGTANYSEYQPYCIKS